MQSARVLHNKIVANGQIQRNSKLSFKNLFRLFGMFFLTLYITPSLSSDKYQYEYFESQLGYFKELTLGRYSENNDNRVLKWVKDISIFVKGDIPATLDNELDSIIVDINNIVSNIQLKRVAVEESANYFIFLGSPEEYLSVDPSYTVDMLEKGGAFDIYFNSDNGIVEGSMYINTTRYKNSKSMKSLLRKLLTGSLGFLYHSPNHEYADSIFSGAKYKKVILNYSNFDKTIIKKLYSKCVKAGMDKFELDNVLLNGC
jgi:hypothetical protein